MLVVLAGLAAGLLRTSPARSCGPLPPVAPTAIPRSGAQEVSTATSLIVLSQGQPQGLTLTLTLQASGQNVPLSAPVSLGGGADGSTAGLGLWQVRPASTDGFLTASAEQVS